MSKVTKTNNKLAILDLPIRKLKFHLKNCTRILWLCNNIMKENPMGGRKGILYLQLVSIFLKIYFS